MAAENENDDSGKILADDDHAHVVTANPQPWFLNGKALDVARAAVKGEADAEQP